MTYKEFGEWCNARATDGQWDMYSATWCISVYQKISEANSKNIFKRKKLRRELWELYRPAVEEIISYLDRHYHYKKE